MIKRLTANARKPNGFWGKLMIKKMNAGHYKMTAWALKKIKFPDKGIIVDIGCGGGNCVNILSSITNANIVGVDYSALCVKNAIKKNKKAIKDGRVEILQADVVHLPIKSNTIDCAVSVESVYFWNDPDKAFREIKRTLKPGGSLNIICEMIKNEDGTGSHSQIAEFLKLNYYSISELKNIFIRCGFDNVQSYLEKDNGWLLISGTA